MFNEISKLLNTKKRMLIVCNITALFIFYFCVIYPRATTNGHCVLLFSIE